MTMAIRHGVRRRQRGLTLMEVLVAMLVMALGLLGIASLQTSTLRYQLGSTERANISLLLGDYVERMRANLPQAPGEVSNSPYLLVDAADAADKDRSYTWEKMTAATLSESGVCASSGCSAATRAQLDMVQWRKAVRHLLPSGVVATSGNTASGINVTFAWKDKDFGGTPTTCTSNTTGMSAQSCCPSSLKIDAAQTGVRCANFTVMP